MKQVSLLNKQLALLRANQVSNPQAAQTLPLDNVTNILNTASSLLPQTSTTTSAMKENVPKKKRRLLEQKEVQRKSHAIQSLVR